MLAEVTNLSTTSETDAGGFTGIGLLATADGAILDAIPAAIYVCEAAMIQNLGHCM